MRRKFSRNYSLSVVLPFVVVLIALRAEAKTPSLFLPAVAYGSGGVVVGSAAVADLNGDGNLDLVVADQNGWVGMVSVLLGNGDGTFQPAVTYNSGGNWASSVAIADVNGDGKLDIVVANYWLDYPAGDTNGTVSVLLGNGDGTFQPPTTYLSGGDQATSVAIADVNGDGWPDLVVAHCTPSWEYSECRSVDGVVGVLLNNGDGTFQPAVIYDSGGVQTNLLVAADFNGDGNPDLAVANFVSSDVSVLLGNGDGTFQTAVTYGACPGPSGLAVADLNGDGKLDLVAGGWDVAVLLGNGDGTFQPPTTYGSGGFYVWAVAVADFNGDGKLDLAVANDHAGNYAGSVGVLLGNGNGTFQPAVNYKSDGKGTRSVAAADLTGDGRPELLVTSNSGPIGVLLNDTAPNATKARLTTSGSPSFVSQPVTFAATITSTRGVVPDGRPVTFYDGDTEIGKGTTANGVATFSTSSLRAGPHTIKAIYPGQGTFRPSFGTVKQMVDKYPTATLLSSSLNPSQFGQEVTFTAQVTSSGPTPTGYVKFLDGTKTLGQVRLSGGVATLTTAKLAVGTHSITAEYSGDADNDKSTSPVLYQVVQ